MAFNSAAALRKLNQGVVAYDGGLNVPTRVKLANAGYLWRLRCSVQMNARMAVAANALDAFGQFCGPINRLTVRLNGTQDLFDCSGYMAAVIAAIDSQYNYGAGQVNPSPPGLLIAPATAGVAAFDGLWSIDLPMAVQLANQPAPLGLVQLALQNMEANLEVRWNPYVVQNQAGLAAPIPGSSVYGTAAAPSFTTAPSGTLTCEQHYFDPVPAPEDQPPLGWIHRWREVQYPVTADGETEIRLPPSNVYLRAVFQYVQGAATALAPNGWVAAGASNLVSPGAINRVQLRWGGALAGIDHAASQIQGQMARHYGGMTLPVGIYVVDLLEETHTDRDLINSAATTDLRITVTTSGGSYAGGAYIRAAFEELVPLSPGFVAGGRPAGITGRAA